MSPDALAEFRFTTGNQSAEFGQAAGGLANEVSRSGTNEIHGVVYDYLRNTVLNANGPIPAVNGQKSSLIQNQFGAAIGGPIRRDKLFAFGDYEGFRRILCTALQATLPSAQQAAGAFVDAGGNPIPIKNPYTNAVYKNGVIPVAALQTTLIPGTSTPQISALDTTVLKDLPTAAPLVYALGDWQVTAINTYVSGLPINITYSPSTAQQVSTLTGFVYRPSLIGTPVLPSGHRTPVAGQPGQYQYLDPAAVSVPTAANTPFGNAPRNVARAPGFADLDLAVHKRFALYPEGVGLEFRAEAFNVLNHSNALAPDSTATDSAYGTISSYYPSRELQVALRLTF